MLNRGLIYIIFILFFSHRAENMAKVDCIVHSLAILLVSVVSDNVIKFYAAAAVCNMRKSICATCYPFIELSCRFSLSSNPSTGIGGFISDFLKNSLHKKWVSAVCCLIAFFYHPLHDHDRISHLSVSLLHFADYIKIYCLFMWLCCCFAHASQQAKPDEKQRKRSARFTWAVWWRA